MTRGRAAPGEIMLARGENYQAWSPSACPTGARVAYCLSYTLMSSCGYNSSLVLVLHVCTWHMFYFIPVGLVSEQTYIIYHSGCTTKTALYGVQQQFDHSLKSSNSRQRGLYESHKPRFPVSFWYFMKLL